MRERIIFSAKALKAELFFGADKSISHRAIICASLNSGKTVVNNFYPSLDTKETLTAFSKMGVVLKLASNRLTIIGKGLNGLKIPGQIVLGNSGTTFRLIAGIVAGYEKEVKISCLPSLMRRPMLRIAEPLTLMGAIVKGSRRAGEIYPPLVIKGGGLKGISYSLPVASAQVKSAVILAGLFAKGITRVIEPFTSRDHTERMLCLYKADIRKTGKKIIVRGEKELNCSCRIYIPGDFSSAAFFIAAALIVSGSQLKLKDIGINPTRIGLLDVFIRMGADINIVNRRGVKWPQEPYADIIVRSGPLKATDISPDEVPLLIDELPIFMVTASLARGVSRIFGAEELKVKETDRVNSMMNNLNRMGADISICKKGKNSFIRIKGVKTLKGVRLKSFADHRTAMSLIIAALSCKQQSSIDDVDCINKSFPDFFKTCSQAGLKIG